MHTPPGASRVFLSRNVDNGGQVIFSSVHVHLPTILLLVIIKVYVKLLYRHQMFPLIIMNLNNWHCRSINLNMFVVSQLVRGWLKCDLDDCVSTMAAFSLATCLKTKSNKFHLVL